MEEFIKELKKTNEYLANLSYQNITGKNPYELLTKEQVIEEYGFGENKVLKMFQDSRLPVQRYTVPFKVQRKALDKYLEESHDYLCG